MPMRDLRGRPIDDADIVMFVGGACMMDGVIASVSAPMALPTPQGSAVLQTVDVLVLYRWQVPQGMPAMCMLADKAGTEMSDKVITDLQKTITRLAERIGKKQAAAAVGGVVVLE